MLADESSIKKSILSEEGRRKRILLLDNVTGSMRSDFLADLLTAPEITGIAPYGHGDESRPNDLTYVLTVNGCELDADLASRFYTVRISKPKDKDIDGWSKKVDSFVAKYRWNVLSDMKDLLENAPMRNREGSRFEVFDSCVLSAACATGEEFEAAAQAIAEDANTQNGDKARGETLTALVETALSVLATVDRGFDANLPTVLTNAALCAIISTQPDFNKWNATTVRQRLLKSELMPKFSKEFERFPSSEAHRERGFYFGMHLQGDGETVTYQVVDANLKAVGTPLVRTRVGTMKRRDK